MSTKCVYPIKAWLKRKHMTQQKLSELTGISMRTISRMVRPEYNGLSANYARVAEVLGVTLTELLEGPGGASE